MTATTPIPDAPGLPPSDPPLAAPPSGGALHGLDPFGLRTFKLLNRWFMVPITRAGYGAWLGSPLSGYILLLRVRGRKSGLVRETPLSYLVADGSVWVLAGFGPKTEWYRNLLAEPAVEVQLPGRVVKGTATEVTTPAVRARVVPSLVRATGLAAFLSGVNPWRVGDEAILAAVDFVPLIRIDAEDGWLDPGPDDPGGRAWIWRQALALGATVAALAVLRRLLR